MNAKGTAVLLILAAVSNLTGCYDYRSGKHWSVDDDSGWQQISGVEWVNKTCASVATVTTRQAYEGYAHSLFLIPLGLGGFANNPPDTRLFVTGRGLNGHCNSAALVVSVNGRVQSDTQVSACSRAPDCCNLNVPVSRDDMESLQVAINTSDASCTYAPLMLDSGRHFCLRETQFGGSDSCD